MTDVSNFGGWLFQCNPRKFRIFAVVASGRKITSWAAKQNRHEMQVGDNAALWISDGAAGYDAGVYAVGTVMSRSATDIVDRQFWVGDAPEPTHFVEVAFDRNVFHSPLSKSVLGNDPDFANAKIMTMPRFTDCALSTSEWHAIEKRIGRHNPTPEPQLAIIEPPSGSSSLRRRKG